MMIWGVNLAPSEGNAQGVGRRGGAGSAHAAIHRSTTDHYEVIMSTTGNLRPASGQIPVTASRKDLHMNTESKLTVEIVSDIV